MNGIVMNNNNGIKVFSFLLFLQFCLSMELWIGWGGVRNTWMAVFGVISLVVVIHKRIPLALSMRNLLICSSYYVVYLIVGDLLGFRTVVTQIVTTLLPIVLIVCIKDCLKPVVLRNITKYYSSLMKISIPLFLLCALINLPSFGTLSFGDGSYGTFSNYLFYVKESGSIRFNGPFLEPGYVGMMGAFLLFANQFNMKNKDNIIILLSIILSFSLAGYVLAFLGFLFILLWQKKLSAGKVLLIVIFLFGSNVVIQSYNGGDNTINSLILSRLQFEGGERSFSGNNRTSLAVMTMFFDMWSDPHTLLFGYPASSFSGLAEWELIGTGFYFFTVTHGLLHVLYIALIYLIILLYSKDKRYSFLFFLFVCLSFWQRNYALWLSWIICYFYSIVSVDQANK